MDWCSYEQIKSTWQYDYEIALFARIGLHCHNFQKVTLIIITILSLSVFCQKEIISFYVFDREQTISLNAWKSVVLTRLDTRTTT